MSISNSPRAVSHEQISRKQVSSRLSGICRAVLVVALPLILVAAAWGQGKALYSFTGTTDGDAPVAGLVRDAAGNLYGATPGGGNQQAEQCLTQINGCGVIFQLTNSGGGWTETVIHSFTPGTDGINPMGNLVLDSAGNLYGTTEFGGNGCPHSYYGCGTVYELSPAGDGSWTEKILYNFKAGADGVYPEAGLIFDSAGNLYGTTGFGANSSCNGVGCGTVFELTPGGDGTWTEHILYVFEDGGDGGEPGSTLAFDKAGNLYGTTATGGNVACNAGYGCGSVYELSLRSGSWTESALYDFNCGQDGCFPKSGVAVDDRGNVYGDMLGGGANGYGYVYKLTPQNGGTFLFTSIYSFDLLHGSQPQGTPLIANGALYGTVLYGGKEAQLCHTGCGGVFRLSLSGTQYSFRGFGNGTTGSYPYGSLTLDPAGNLYGTTSASGAHGAGTVFEVIQ